LEGHDELLCRNWQTVLEKVFGVTTKIFRVADALARGDMRDHITTQKRPRAAYGAHADGSGGPAKSLAIFGVAQSFDFFNTIGTFRT
jgi:hypothetical protein